MAPLPFSKDLFMHFQSLYCPTTDQHQLHVMHISQPKSKGVPILMIHGMCEDGHIFYHESGKGLACYLAQKGFDVYVADLRGIGKSTPKIGPHCLHGQTETITEDLPQLIEFVKQHSGQPHMHMAAHSWGGVNINSCLLRRPDLIPCALSSVYFGSKRSVRAKTFNRYLMINLFCNNILLLLGKIHGYVPAVKYNISSGDTTAKTHAQCVDWIKQDNWIDTDDGFNYGQAAKTVTLPPTLYYAAINDLSLGHRFDVQNFIKESGNHHHQYVLLGEKNGNALDYDHNNMLTAQECLTDHFPNVLGWFNRHLMTNGKLA